MSNPTTPPKLPLRFFRWFCHPAYREDIEGDLLERFEKRAGEGTRKAKWHFALDVIKLFRPEIIKPIEGHHHLNHYGMLKNYFKVSWRNLARQKLYAAINIGGLTIGLLCFLLIFLYVQHELSFDKFYPNAERIHRIYQRQSFNSYLGSDYFAATPARLASTLMQEYPEVAYATSIQTPTILLNDESSHYWEKSLSADKHFFDVFPYHFLEGNPKAALENPESIVLTKSLAEKIFGEKEAIGQKLIYGDQAAYVTGVIVDPPKNSSLQFSCVVSIAADSFYKDEFKKEKWAGNAYYTFFTSVEGASGENLQEKMPQLLKKYWAYADNYPEYFIQPLTDVHLQAHVNDDIGLRGNSKQLALFSLVAILVLILACINYINLAIARSVNRAKEVGLRKVIGAHKSQLTFQFLAESVLLAFISLLLAILLLPLLLPVFGYMVDRPLSFEPAQHIYLVPGLLGLVILIGIISGSYPAIFMSSLKPILVLKGKLVEQRSNRGIQKVLIVGQYAVSIVMLVCSLIIYRQFQFIGQKELGFNKEHIVTIA